MILTEDKTELYPISEAVDKETSPEITFEEDEKARVEFIVPPLENNNELYPEALAIEQAAWAVGAYPSENIVESFLQTQRELMEEGTSKTVEGAKARWKEEQDVANKMAISEILSDSSISKEKKLNILSQYASGGYVSKSLKDKFIQRVASEDTALTQSDREAQDEAIKNLKGKVEDSKIDETKDKVKSFYENSKSVLLGMGIAIDKIVKSIPASIAEVGAVIYENDYKKGEQFAKEVAKKHRDIQIKTDIYDEIQDRFKADPLANKTANTIYSIAEAIGIPFKWIEDKVYELTGSPRVATISEVLSEGIAGGAAAVGIRSIKGTPKIKAGSPADIMAKANKPVAGEMYKAALDDPNGTLAKALGTDKGSILADAALPKLDQVLNDYPDLHQQLVNDMDVKADYSFDLLKYDPNIVNTAKREADLDLILSVAKEHVPYYQQANSVFTTPGQGIYEGKMVFGKNANYPFTSKEAAQEAFKTIQTSIKNIPDEFKGKLELVKVPDGWKVEYSWKKQYDEFESIAFGADSIKPTGLGGLLDFSGLARSMGTRWMFTRGILDPKYEASQARSITRAAKQTHDLLTVIRPLVNTSYPKELSRVINEMEVRGVDVLSKKDLEGMFASSLSRSEIKDVYSQMVQYRRATHYIHRIRNFNERDKLSSQGFQSVYKEDGSWLANVNPKVDKDSLDRAVTLLDMDSGVHTPKGKIVEKNGKLIDEATGRQVVTLPRREAGDSGTDFVNLALAPAKSRLGTLQAQVIPRIPGWAPRMYKDHWFIEATPGRASMNGVDIHPKDLWQYKSVKASARTSFEAEAIMKELEASGRHAGSTLSIRRERADTYQPLELDYNLGAEMFAHSKKRGEDALYNATIEDPLVALVKTIQSTARNNTKYAFDEATQKSFIKEYGDLTGGKFPNSVKDIGAGIKGVPEARIKEAVKVFNNYAAFNNFSYATQEIWKGMLHSVADILEKIKIPASLLRDASRKEMPLISVPRKIATALWISLNPQRQWVIQPQHAFELAVLSGKDFFNISNRMMQHFQYFVGESPMLKGIVGDSIKYMAKSKNKVDRREFELESQAMHDVGLVEAVDTNALIHSVFTDLTQPLVPTPLERVAKGLENASGLGLAKAVTRTGRQIGYDKGELLNQIGAWLFAKDKWVKDNPGKNWNTPEVKEFITNAAFNLTGNMNKAGNLPYQQGALSPFFQFQAIGHKNFMNVLQDNATILTPKERLALTAFRLAWLGGKYGLPGGGTFLKIAELTNVPQEDRQLFEKGLADYLVNGFWNMMYPEEVETTGAVSKSFSSFGQETGLPYGDIVLEMYKIVNKDKSDNPRFPVSGVITSVSDTIDRLDMVFGRQDLSTPDKWLRGFNEGLRATSGWNNVFKGAYMLAHENKINSKGVDLDLQFSTGDAINQMWGITTEKEADAYKMQALLTEPNRLIKDTAAEIYKQLNQYNSSYTPDTPFLEDHKNMLKMVQVMCDEDSPVCTPEMYDEIIDEVINLAGREKSLSDNLIRRFIEEGKHKSSKSIQEAMALGKKYPELQPYVEAMEKGNP